MPNKEFLETYPLYRKFKCDTLPGSLEIFNRFKVKINMFCPICHSNQTYVMKNNYLENFNYHDVESHNTIVRLSYLCTHCDQFNRFFFVKINNESDKWLMKVGQLPAWEVAGVPNVEKLLGKHAGYFKKGQICESQGYGIVITEEL